MNLTSAELLRFLRDVDGGQGSTRKFFNPAGEHFADLRCANVA